MRAAVEQTKEGLDWLIDCVNEYSIATRDAADEMGRALPEIPGGPEEASSLQSDDLVQVANGWFEVFHAAPDARAVAAVLNNLLDQAAPQIAAVTEADEVQSSVRLTRPVNEATRLSVWGALVLLDTVASIGVDRLGVCSGDRCVDVYVDRSPRHNRRYCSQLCQTRERVSRYRRQQ